MKVKITVNELLDSIGQIKNLQNNVHSVKFSYALVKIKKTLTEEAKKIDQKFKFFQTKRNDLCIKYCEKDESGKPIIENDKYKGLVKGENPEFDKVFQALEKERDDYLNSEVVIKDVYGISKDLVPEKLNGLQYEAILPFIVEKNNAKPFMELIDKNK